MLRRYPIPIKSIWAVLVLLFILSNSIFVIADSSDENLSELIVGTWVDDPRDDFYGGRGHITTYHDDGTVTYFGFLDRQCTVLDVVVRAAWKIQDQKLIISVTESTDIQLFPVGYTVVDTVISISEKHQVLESDTGEMQYRLRSNKCIIAHET